MKFAGILIIHTLVVHAIIYLVRINTTLLNQFTRLYSQLQSRVSFMLTISHSRILRIFALAYKTLQRFSIHLLTIWRLVRLVFCFRIYFIKLIIISH